MEEVNDDDVDDFMNQVSHINDPVATASEDAAKQNIKSISNDVVPSKASDNLAKVDEYEYDSSDEEVRLVCLEKVTELIRFSLRMFLTQSATSRMSGTKITFTLATT